MSEFVADNDLKLLNDVLIEAVDWSVELRSEYELVHRSFE